MLLYLLSTLDRLLLANAMGLSMLLSGALSLGQLVPLLVCSRAVPSPTPGLSLHKVVGSHCKISYMHLVLLLILPVE